MSRGECRKNLVMGGSGKRVSPMDTKHFKDAYGKVASRINIGKGQELELVHGMREHDRNGDYRVYRAAVVDKATGAYVQTYMVRVHNDGNVDAVRRQILVCRAAGASGSRGRTPGRSAKQR